MLRTKAFYAPQVVTDATAAAWADEWVLLAREFTTDLFRDALTMAVRESDFFPRPQAIRRQCDGLMRARRLQVKASKVVQGHDDARDQWLREYFEDVAGGVVRKPLSPELERLARQLGLADPDPERRADDARAAA